MSAAWALVHYVFVEGSSRFQREAWAPVLYMSAGLGACVPAQVTNLSYMSAGLGACVSAQVTNLSYISAEARG